MTLTGRSFLALLLALAIGIGVSALGSPALLALAAGAEPLGRLWMNALLMTVIPLVVASLVTGIAATSDTGLIGRIGGRAVALFLLFLAAAGVVTALLAPVLLAWLEIDPATSAALRSSVAEAASEGPRQAPGAAELITGLVPKNPVQAAAEGALLPLIVFTVAFAAAASRIPPELRMALVRFFEAVREAMLVLIGWILRLAPLGVFALVLPLAARMGAGVAGALGYFVLVASLVPLLFTLALYPLASLFGGVPLRRFAQAAAPAQAVAFSSRSSLASLPALMEGARDRLGLSPAVSGFFLPLAVSTFKFAAPMAHLVAVAFVARLYAIEIHSAQLPAILFTSVLLSFSVPGIAGGSMAFATAAVFLAAGLPVEAAALLLAVDVIPDIFRTVANVTADLAGAAILSRHGGATPAMADLPAELATQPVAAVPVA